MHPERKRFNLFRPPGRFNLFRPPGRFNLFRGSRSAPLPASSGGACNPTTRAAGHPAARHPVRVPCLPRHDVTLCPHPLPPSRALATLAGPAGTTGPQWSGCARRQGGDATPVGPGGPSRRAARAPGGVVGRGWGGRVGWLTGVLAVCDPERARAESWHWNGISRAGFRTGEAGGGFPGTVDSGRATGPAGSGRHVELVRLRMARPSPRRVSSRAGASRADRRPSRRVPD
jgi:hypothetical protein